MIKVFRQKKKPIKISFHNNMRLNLDGKLLKTGYNNDPPYTLIQSSINRLYGIEPKIIRTMARYFNFTIKFIDCKNIYGNRLLNGSFNGMMGMLENEQIDFGIGGVMMSYERNSIIRYLYTYQMDHLTFITNQDYQTQINYYLLITPFTGQVWLMILFILLIFYLIKQIRINLMIKCKQQQQQSFVDDYHDDLWIGIGLFFRQPYYRLQSTNLSIKIMMLCWAISAFILSTLYAGFLTSTLSIPNNNCIDTIQRLADECYAQNIIPLIQANTSAIKIFSRSDRNDFQMIWQKTQQIINTEQGIKMIFEQNVYGKKFSLITSRYPLQYYQFKYGKNLLYLPPEQLESSFYPFFVSIPIRKTFEHIESFNILIFHLQCSGLLKKWLNDEFHVRLSGKEFTVISNQYIDYDYQFIDDDVNEQPNPSHQFTNEQLVIIFHLHFWCLTFCMAIFFIEYFSYFYHHHHQKNVLK
ncbi:ionotropic receptor 40a-like [Dermatophagoides pteronyssinus]|uniref:ionotropic receptor 40a-like n=1 Tax=Dermatophagoides pteronyssinus TaxID=6956 RepID=UPI003F67B644